MWFLGILNCEGVLLEFCIDIDVFFLWINYFTEVLRAAFCEVLLLLKKSINSSIKQSINLSIYQLTNPSTHTLRRRIPVQVTQLKERLFTHLIKFLYKLTLDFFLNKIHQEAHDSLGNTEETNQTLVACISILFFFLRHQYFFFFLSLQKQIINIIRRTKILKRFLRMFAVTTDINTVANFVRVFLLATNVTSHEDLEGNSLLTLCLEFQN